MVEHLVDRLRTRVRRTPPWLKAPLAGVFHYGERLSRWPLILKDVKGVTWRDQGALLLSAAWAPVISARDPMRWQDPVLVCDARVRVTDIGVLSIRSHTDDLWHAFPPREREVFAAIRRILSPGDVFVDAGANIGVCSLVAAQVVGSSGKVIAIEMMPRTALKLREHLEMNQLANVTVVERPLSAHSNVRVVARVDESQCGQATIGPSTNRQDGEQELITTTLDEVCSEIREVRLMKVDLEGVDFEALSGGREVLARTGAVIFECKGHKGVFSDKSCELLREMGFSMRGLDGNNVLAFRS